MFEKQIDLSTVIRNFREERSLTLRDLSERVQLSHTFIGKIEKGKGNANPTAVSIAQIANGLNLPFYQLLISANQHRSIKSLYTEDLGWNLEQLREAFEDKYRIEALHSFGEIYTFKKKIIKESPDGADFLNELEVSESRMIEISLMHTDVTLYEAFNIAKVFYTPFDKLFRVKKMFYDFSEPNNDDANVAYQVHKHIEENKFKDHIVCDQSSEFEFSLSKLITKIKTLEQISYLKDSLELYKKYK